MSRYLAAFQLGYIDRIWDPFFGESTRQVLNSEMSHLWPVFHLGGALIVTVSVIAMGRSCGRGGTSTCRWA